MYADATVMETFERDAVCVTADCKFALLLVLKQGQGQPKQEQPSQTQFVIVNTLTFSDTLQKHGKIGILNSERLETETGDGKNITGYAYTPDLKEPGKLKVHLEGVPLDAPCKWQFTAVT